MQSELGQVAMLLVIFEGHPRAPECLSTLLCGQTQMVLSFLAKDPSDARSQHNVMEALCHVTQSASGHRCFSGRTVYVGSPEMLPAFPQYEEAPSASFSNNAGMGYHTAQCMADKRHHCHPRRPPPTPPTRDTVGSSSLEFFDI